MADKNLYALPDSMRFRAYYAQKRRRSRNGGDLPFSIADLFSSGQDGAWYQPNEITTLFQNSSGAAPVTADSQPVGLMLDKSQGLELGSELITNGDFSDGSTGWVSNGESNISGGEGHIISTDGSYSALYQIPPLEIGKTYFYSFDVTVTSGILSVVAGLGAERAVSQSGIATGYITAVGTSFEIKRRFGSIVAATIDNVSVKEVLGNHARQPVSAARPTYNVTPDRLTLDKVDDAIIIDIPVGGWTGSMVLGTVDGTASYGVTIPAGEYTLGGTYFPSNTINNLLLRDGAVSASDLAKVESDFVSQGATASYGAVTDFTNYWRDMGEITEFPLIDTSSGITFYASWFGNSLTSFPLIDTSSGINFQAAWYNNALTSFPLLDTSSGISFQSAWQNNNLTSFPLIDTSSGINLYATWYNNNLTSFPLIDTSSGTNFKDAWSHNNLTSFPLIDTSSGTNFQGAWLNNNLTSFPLIDTSSGTSFSQAWFGNSLTSFPLLDTSSGTNFSQAWFNNNLTSFPLIDTSSGTNFTYAWFNNNLTSFPLIDTSSATSFNSAWRNNDLTSFPLIDTSSGTDFQGAWFGSNLTSFPLIDTSSGTSFQEAWRYNGLLATFPANMFDTCLATNFTNAFNDTNLSESSIDGILVSINSNGTSNGTFGQSGGNAPSSTGEAAITAMRSRGWTITVTGGF